jgi:hypothetical protein
MDMGQLFHIAGRFWLRRDNLEDRTHDFGRWLLNLSVSEVISTAGGAIGLRDCHTYRWKSRRPIDPLVGRHRRRFY